MGFPFAKGFLLKGMKWIWEDKMKLFGEQMDLLPSHK